MFTLTLFIVAASCLSI